MDRGPIMHSNQYKDEEITLVCSCTVRLWEETLDFFHEHELEVSMFASGLTGKQGEFSLSSPNEDLRKKRVSKIIGIANMIDSEDIGIILGFFKGPIMKDKARAGVLFQQSLIDIKNELISMTPILVEAPNRYETSVANSLFEAETLLPESDIRFSILPDTFHMNIEESNMYDALHYFCRKIRNLHLSDNNRFFPGFVSIDFYRVLDILSEKNHTGCLSIEGDINSTLVNDLRKSVEYLNDS